MGRARSSWRGKGRLEGGGAQGEGMGEGVGAGGVLFFYPRDEAGVVVFPGGGDCVLCGGRGGSLARLEVKERHDVIVSAEEMVMVFWR